MPAPSAPLTVYFWPDSVDNITVNQSVIVIAVRTLPETLRSQARDLIRTAITDVLAKKLNCACAEIKLISQLGKPLKLAHPRHSIGLSISHETGLSLAAINMNGMVGVDLIDINNIPNNNEIFRLASEYLGTEVAEDISLLPSTHQKHAFAKAWTEFEANLKCQEKSLSEWAPSRILQLKPATTQSFDIPENYIGTLVF